jgi:hypothetical protein
MSKRRLSPPLNLDPLRAVLVVTTAVVVVANIVVGALFWAVWYKNHYWSKDPSRVCPVIEVRPLPKKHVLDRAPVPATGRTRTYEQMRRRMP